MLVSRHFLIIYLAVFARFLFTTYYLKAGDPSRYIALAKSAPEPTLFIAHILANFDPFFYILTFIIGCLSGDLLLPTIALAFAIAYLVLTENLKIQRSIAIIIIILILMPFNTMGNFITGAWRQTFATSLVILGFYMNSSVRIRLIMIIFGLLSHVSMVIIVAGFLVEKMWQIFKRAVSRGFVKRANIIAAVFIIILSGVLFNDFVLIVANKLNQYREIGIRENIIFGNIKLGFIVFHFLIYFYGLNKKAGEVQKIGLVLCIIYTFVILLTFVDVAMAIRVFNGVYYITPIYFCALFFVRKNNASTSVN